MHNILKPLKIGAWETANRLMRSATCEYMADESGKPKQELIDLYKQLAAGKTGVFVTGFCYVMPNGISTPGQSGIHSDALIPAWQEAAAVFKDSPALLLMQIVHGGRQVRPKSNPGPVWAPSPVPDPVHKTEPLEMTAAQVEETIEAFIEAAVRAEKAGFHGVQLHVAHGYLLSQFLSPYTNRRDDAFGGDQEKRTRIAVEILKGIKARVGEKFILSAKVNGVDFLPGGLTLQQAVISANLMKAAGLDFIEVSGGMAEAKNTTVKRNIESPGQEGYFLPQARTIRREVGLPTAVVGGFRSLTVMEQALASGAADLISLCRPFIREPDLPLKFEKQEIDRVSCVSCNGCFNPRGIRCKHTG
ncbi:MAG: NADH:flavin oxidoreductase [Candidatus Aminicenantes bacterium]|nr:NADH:flavin oxidoreductase [Candidatus Aminicenantes bacterium]